MQVLGGTYDYQREGTEKNEDYYQVVNLGVFMP